MGKNDVIKSLSKVIANIALHKLVFAHTNKPESKHFLESEIIEYRSVAQNKALEFNWNESDKKKIHEISLNLLKKEKDTKYPDIEFPDEEAEKIMSETINDLL
ncbi:hypothetical protein J4402_03995 [Candidatus Pacearchaeota archaeon]|nr:hypothetical protein [Candidatus Pacearchaeota archaeon]